MNKTPHTTLPAAATKSQPAVDHPSSPSGLAATLSQQHPLPSSSLPSLPSPVALSAVRLSPNFTLGEFLNLPKYPENVPTPQVIANLVFGCHLLLEPARKVVGPILVNSGFRCEQVNRKVGGVVRSQHLLGQAADIRPSDPSQFLRLVDFLRRHPLTDQLLTGTNWLHVSWNPFATARHDVRIGFYR